MLSLGTSRISPAFRSIARCTQTSISHHLSPSRPSVPICWRYRLSHNPFRNHSHGRHPVPAGRPQRAANSRTSRTLVIGSVAAALIFYFSNLQTVPVSGRKRFNCFSEESVRMVADMQYQRILSDVEAQARFLPDWDPRVRIVRRVMARLIPVCGEGANPDEWEVRVIDDPRTANAFVLPGGKVFVFSGILPLVRNEDGLAAVLAHEIAHNLAEHIGERLSGSIGVNILLGCMVLLSFGLGMVPVYYFGGGLLDLMFERPMGRRQESEADYIGLMMMAEACYDPREAVVFWQLMHRATRNEPPEWISTHPSNKNRIEQIQKWMPKALEKREMSDCQGTQGFADMFRRALDRGILIIP